MTKIDYPALFLCADEASNRYQAHFLRLVQGEYATLFLASIFSMSFLTGTWYYVCYAFVFIAGLVVLLTRALRKPEQDWYRCRALAESVKTLTWRYVMRAAPFGDLAESGHQAQAEFRNQLHSVFAENRATAEKIVSDWSGNDQITDRMQQIRLMSLSDRIKYYINNRIDEQREWYARKAIINRRGASFWVTASSIAYVLATALVITRIAAPDWPYWPIEPLIVVAASVVGWMQIRKFNELCAAYTVTAHEIGLIKMRTEATCSEEDFSQFVNDAEKAFSREHTLWIARQSD
ncbi:DUF4231 domain-containing protein [Blastochloris sulfoviridis]|uniref:DUF4231 domain-containing protein n=1 Tax=Blastochloris sulfoviridis TaxID=50712 RepID=A0A5M6HNR3_9HYPH|nr:DUF4231 domain-containing protein [Blastochloris sulfoviridis]KAA5597308.1 DUF4231 domain-containing protein [Blastochloris sulfoviridis]